MEESTRSMRFEDDEEGELLKVGVPLLTSRSSVSSADTQVTEERSMSMASNMDNE